MRFKQDWNNSNLADYLLYDEWEFDKAFRLLAGSDYKNNNPLYVIDNVSKPIKDLSSKIQRDLIEKKLARLEDFWNSGNKRRIPSSPLFFIEWALSKRFRPEWLDWAIEKGLYTEKQAATIDIALLPFDVKSEFYPPELDIALRAWQAVSANNGKSKPKTQIKDWLNSCELKINGKKLSNDAKERISTVANWDKFGGATRTE